MLRAFGASAIAAACLLAYAQAEEKQPSIRTKDGNVMFESPGGFCFGVNGKPAGFAEYKGDQGDQGQPGVTGPQGKPGRDGLDCMASDPSRLVYGLVPSTVAMWGAAIDGSPNNVMGPAGDPADRVVNVLGVGLGQFYHPMMQGKHGLFSCVLADSKVPSRNMSTGMAGVEARKHEANGLVTYQVPCVVPNWPSKWTQSARLHLEFNKQAMVAYKGNSFSNLITFKSVVLALALTADGVLVKGAGFNTASDYACIFVAGSNRKQTRVTKPLSTSAINCGPPPDLFGAGYSGPTVAEMSVLLTSKDAPKGLPFEGADAASKFSVDLCKDGAKNGAETDVDCGGKCATKCAMLKTCKAKDDCAGGFPCVGGKCGAIKCTDLYTSGLRKSGVYSLYNTATSKMYKVYCTLADSADGRGWTGAVGSGGENPGWIYVDTCGKSREVGPTPDECRSTYAKASPKASSDLLPWVKTLIGYDDSACKNNFCNQGQRGIFQYWEAPRDVEVEFQVYGAGGTICTWTQPFGRLARGGLASGRVQAKAGDRFYFIVGQKGRPGTNRAGGFGGGGRSITTGGVGGSSGSGGSHVFFRAKGQGAPPFPSTDNSDYRILVGGGGGASSTENCQHGEEDRSGGDGGGGNGVRGRWGNECGGGYGGQQNRGGSRGCSHNQGQTSGDRYYGGRGPSNDGGGGGGGYWGGGGGGYNSGGGGGSGFVDAAQHGGVPSYARPKSTSLKAGAGEAPGTRGGRNDQNTQWDLKGEGKILFRFR